MSNIFIIFVILCFSLCIKDHSDTNTNKMFSRTGIIEMFSRTGIIEMFSRTGIIEMFECLNETYS